MLAKGAIAVVEGREVDTIDGAGGESMGGIAEDAEDEDVASDGGGTGGKKAVGGAANGGGTVFTPGGITISCAPS